MSDVDEDLAHAASDDEIEPCARAALVTLVHARRSGSVVSADLAVLEAVRDHRHRWADGRFVVTAVEHALRSRRAEKPR